MKKLLPLLAVLALAVTSLAGAPLQHSLGQGLAYVRVHSLPADLPAPLAKPAPLVLDLRYAKTDQGGAEALAAWLKFNARPASPIFVLANAETAPALRKGLVADRTSPSLIVIGPAAAGFVPDIAVTATTEAERSAYDALEHGATIESLTVENADKVRHDEASLAGNRASPHADGDSPEANDPDTIDDTDQAPATPATAPKAGPIDATLQRAIEIERGLAALRRI